MPEGGVVRKHLHGEDILPCANNVSDIKLGRQTAVLAVSQQLPIQPCVEGVIHSLEMDGDPAMHAWYDQLPLPLMPSHQSLQQRWPSSVKKGPYLLPFQEGEMVKCLR